MYLHSRLLLGIGAITVLALALSVLVPLGSVRSDVSRETDASMQLAQLLLDIQHSTASASSPAEARAAAGEAIRHANDLRHVRVTLLDATGKLVATSPSVTPRAGRIARALAASGEGVTLRYPVAFQERPWGELRVAANPLSELSEFEIRVLEDTAVLMLAITALGGAILVMVRRGLRPITQIQAALTSLQAGNLEMRLPRFRLRDVDDISQRFNQCAAAMQEAAVQRRHLTRRVIEAEEEERKRLARELHDELGQSLTAIKVDAAYIAREARDTSHKIVDSAHAIEQSSNGIMDLIRSMLARLRPHGLETVGLRETLEDLVSGWQARVADRFQCTLEMQGPVDLLPADLNITLYRLIQECLTNAVRHSRARAIAIRLSVEPARPAQGADPSPAPGREIVPSAARVTIEVREAGVVSPGVHRGPEGTGLLGMRERVEAHGGELRVDIDAVGGLSLHAWMPAGARGAQSDAS